MITSQNTYVEYLLPVLTKYGYSKLAIYLLNYNTYQVIKFEKIINL